LDVKYFVLLPQQPVSQAQRQVQAQSAFQSPFQLQSLSSASNAPSHVGQSHVGQSQSSGGQSQSQSSGGQSQSQTSGGQSQSQSNGGKSQNQGAPWVAQQSSSMATIDQIGWTALLNSASALQMYRQQVHSISPREVAAFLLLDGSFPRSIRYCIHAAQESLHAITGSPIGCHRTEAERLMGILRASLDYANIDQIMEFGLHEYLDELQNTLNEIGGAVHKRFFELAD
jgi:hypothetical protein